MINIHRLLTLLAGPARGTSLDKNRSCKCRSLLRMRLVHRVITSQKRLEQKRSGQLWKERTNRDQEDRSSLDCQNHRTRQVMTSQGRSAQLGRIILKTGMVSSIHVETSLYGQET